MFKNARWRSEKNKIKTVFKLQFHATQVVQVGKDTLMVSLVPVEVGRPTVRLEKTPIRDGNCRWENPIYETVKFIQESKTGKVSEKRYQFIVSTGSSKVGVLGEVSIDFADYFDAVKPSSVSLPLKTSNSGPILHVTIQRIQGAVEQSDVVENGDATIDDRSLRRKLSNGDTDENSNCNTSEAGGLNKSVTQSAEPNGDVVATKRSDGISGSTSESSSGRDTPRELGFKNNSIHQEPTSLLSPLSHTSMPHRSSFNAITMNGQEHRRTNTEWSVGSGPEGSADGSTNSSDDNLKRDLVILARQAEVSELELQTLRKQIVKESKRGQDLVKEVIGLKEERDTLRKECEQLKSSQKRADNARVLSKSQFETEDPWTLLQEIRQELNYEKDLNTNLRLQLQKTQESNSELILAVQDLDDMLEQKNREVSYLSNKPAGNQNAEEIHEPASKQHETDDDEEQQALEQLVKEHNDTKDTYLLEQKIIDLCSEIEVYRRDRDELEMQMEQLALDYEILKQENHDMLAKLEQNYLQEQLKAQYENPNSFSTMNELETQIENLENELKEQKEEASASLGAINELETQVESLEKELKEQKEEASASLGTISELETQIESLEKELKEQKQNASASLGTVNELETQIESLEKELMEQKEEASASLGTISELEIQIGSLEKQLKEQKEKASAYLGTINELKSQIQWLEKRLDEQKEESTTFLDTIGELKSEVTYMEIQLDEQKEESSTFLGTIGELKSEISLLENELEKQADGFETDLEAVTRAKIEQEQRAIRAEETLRKTRLYNANTAERLQEEFRRLSIQMASTFDANEKLAMKAATEANELRLQKIHLEEMLDNANEELGFVRDQYEEKLKVLSDQIDLERKKCEQLLLELEDKSKQLEHKKKNEEELHEDVSKEILMLRAEVEKLRGQNNDTSEEAEVKEKLRVDMEKIETSRKEMELLVREGNVERNELEKTISSLRQEAEMSLEQLNTMRSVKDEKEKTVEILQSELEVLRSQYKELKHSLFEDGLEKEKLKKHVFDLKVDLKKKEDKITATEKKLKESSGRTTVFDGIKPNSKNSKSSPPPRGSKEVASLREKIKLLEGQIKLKEASLENLNNSFLEKEKDLSCRIEELENRVVELNQNSTTCCEDQFHKEVKEAEDVTNRASQGYMSEQNGHETGAVKSSTQSHLDELLSEMTSLKERNQSMEGELRDMQERYSEISLKFAEVEGERQKLVMSVRNLKNAKKN